MRTTFPGVRTTSNAEFAEPAERTSCSACSAASALIVMLLTLAPLPAAAASVPLDLTGVRAGPIAVSRDADSVTVTWPDEAARVWRAAVSPHPSPPPLHSLPSGAEPHVRSPPPVYHGGNR